MYFQEYMNYSYTFNNIKDIHAANLSRTFLWILYADKTPPHIGISVQGYFFSLKTEGKDENIPLELLQNVVLKKKITSVAVQLSVKVSLTEIQLLFKNYSSIREGESCLTPILQALGKGSSLSTVSELLKDLEDQDQIKAFFGLNLYPRFKGLNTYSSKDIQQRIQTLRNV